MNAALPSTIVLPTVQELQAHVTSQPEGSVIGICQSSGHCMLADYLEKAYPDLRFSVTYYPLSDAFLKAGKVHVTYWHRGTTPDDSPYKEVECEAPDLTRILERFDRLMGWNVPITREQALPCFEEKAHA